MQTIDLDELGTLRDWVRWGASQFRAEGLVFGHGSDNPLDEALALVLHALHLDHDLPETFLDCQVTSQEAAQIVALFERRIDDRVPVAYLVGKAYFAGLEFEVTPQVLIPRSPIAELIESGFSPWLDPERVRSVLDLCCGSGCIGIACAYTFAEALVDLADISRPALDVAQRNIERHELDHRVRAVHGDLFEAVEGERYDLIVSNPPYVSLEEMAALPDEYHHEPAGALEAGQDGMDVVARILAEAGDFLAPNGVVVVEVGASAQLLLARYPSVPFLWLDFEHGGDGVFLLTAEQIDEYRDIFGATIG
jgi:ribosomal protein L3 glutamine methyltransferase